MKVTIEYHYDEKLARAVAIKNGGRGEGGPEEIKSWALWELVGQAEELIEETRAQMEAQEP